MAVAQSSLSLRRARPEDCRLVWEWANAPEVRAASFTTAPIPWESHQEWFAARLQDPNCHFFIILGPEQQPWGQIRFDPLADQQATISITLAPEARGQGLGAAALRLAASEIFRTTSLTAIHAYIKPDNIRSIRAFRTAGFRLLGRTQVKGQLAEHYLLTREAGTGTVGEEDGADYPA